MNISASDFIMFFRNCNMSDRQRIELLLDLYHEIQDDKLKEKVLQHIKFNLGEK